ncbi:MAG: hypothetical protein C0624_10890 [Desulfuromonas sp.]|nr:MAG: hypothetical protein C0624_10890 [Desulfuromonas sp.]
MRRHLLSICLLVLLLAGCVDTTSRSHAVYMLIDTSGTYTMELDKAQSIINYLLGTLNPGDALAVARIDTGSFSEKDIVAKATFDDRPSVSNEQKRTFVKKVNDYVKQAKGSAYTDITGGILQAIEFLNETEAGRKTILVFSDLVEDLKPGHIRDIPLQLSGIEVVALNVTKLRQDIVDPRKYLGRLDDWRGKVESGQGSWRVVNDLDRLDRILQH